MPREYYIGCISGTSLDGLDLALVSFEEDSCEVAASFCEKIPDKLQADLSSLCSPGPSEIERLGRAHTAFGRFIGHAINKFIEAHQFVARSEIKAIGSHGQTIRHRPDLDHPFSIQIGSAAAVSEITGITTVADFRMADLMSGGQGAPLVPAFHKQVFTSEKSKRLIINLGGISNISVLPQEEASASVYGYDIGPANALMDRWTEKHLGTPYDKDGRWAQTGEIIEPLLSKLLSDEYFSRATPKSTGREYFNMTWLEKNSIENASPKDIQRTLLELTATTVADAIKQESTKGPVEIYVCGGGSHNAFLVERIKALSDATLLNKTDTLGLPADDVEAAAFAWLARETLERRPGNLPSVTGAKKAKILGAIHYA